MKKTNNSAQQSDLLFKAIQQFGKGSDSRISIIQQIKQFYVCEMHKILKTYSRGKILSSILIAIYFIQLLGIIISPSFLSKLLENIDYGVFIKKSAQYIKYFNLYSAYEGLRNQGKEITAQQTFDQQSEFMFGIAVLNSLLILYMMMRLCYFIIFQFQANQINEEYTLNSISKCNQRISMIDTLFSFIFRIYNYTILMPCAEFAFKIIFAQNSSINRSIIQMIIGCFSLFSGILISLLVQLHEYNYSIYIKDYLSQQRTSYKNFSYVLDITSCFFLFLDSAIAIQIYQIVNSVLRIVLLFTAVPFNYKKFQLMIIQIWIFLLFFIISFSISTYSSSNQISFPSLMIIIFPISYQLGKWIDYQAHLKNSYNLPFLMIDKQNTLQARKFDQYIRNSIGLFTLPIEEYMKNGKGVIFETIFTNHFVTCAQEYHLNIILDENNKCFCYRFREKFSAKKMKAQQEKEKLNFSVQKTTNFLSKEIGKEESQEVVSMRNEEDIEEELEKRIANMFGSEHRKSFLVSYFGKAFEQFFTSSNNNNKDSSLQIKPTFIYFLLQIAKTPAKAYQQILFLKQQMKTSELQSQALLQEIIEDTQKSFNQFLSSCPYQNQRLMLSAVFRFDKEFNDLKSIFKEAILQQQHFYQFLCSDYINLQELLKQSIICINSKRKVEISILNLFDMNPNHVKIVNIAELYIDLFDFRKRRVRHFIQRSKELTKMNLQKIDLKVNIFEQQSCVIFISLHSQKITRVSDSAYSFFKYSANSKELIEKPFTHLFPDFIGSNINNFLNSFLEEGNMHPMKIGEYFSYIKQRKSNRLIIPVYFRIKVDIIEKGDLGLTILFSYSDSHKVSVITEGNLLVIAFTSNLQRLFLKHYYDNRGEKSSKSNQKLINLIVNFFLIDLTSVDPLKGANLKNFIPALYWIDIQNAVDINSLKGYNESYGFKDQRTLKYETFKSLLLLPTCYQDLHILNNKVIEKSHDLSQYFEKLHSTKLKYYEITFSVFKRVQYSQTGNQSYIIDIVNFKQLKTSNEVNELVIQLRKDLERRFQNVIKISSFLLQDEYVKERDILSSRRSMINIENSIDLTIYDIESPKKQSRVVKQEKKEIPTLNNLDSNQNQMHLLSPSYEKKFEFPQESNSGWSSPVQLLDPQGQIIHQDRQFKIKPINIDDTGYLAGSTSRSNINKDDGEFKNGALSFENFDKKASRWYQDSNSQRVQDESITSPLKMPLTPIRNLTDCTNQFLYPNEQDQLKLPYSPASPTTQTNTQYQARKEQSESNFHLTQLKQQIFNFQHEKDGILLFYNSDIQEDSDISKYKTNTKFESFQYQSLQQAIKGDPTSTDFTYEEFSAPKSALKQKRMKRKGNVKETSSILTAVNQNYFINLGDKEEDKQDDENYKESIDDKFNGRPGCIKTQAQILSEDEMDEDEKNRKTQNQIMDDQQSVRSGQSQVFSQRQSLFQMIIRAKEPSQIYISRMVGAIAVMIIVITTSILFSQVKNNFDQQWINYSNLVIGPQILESFSQILRVKELLTFIQVGQMYKYLFSSFNATVQKAYMNEAIMKLSNITHFIGNLENHHLKEGFESYMIHNQTTLIFSNKINTSIHHTEQYSPIYSLTLFPTNLMAYLLTDDLYSRSFVYLNYNSFVGIIRKLLQVSTDQAIDRLNQTEDLLQFSEILVEVVCVCAVLIIFPIYYKIQQKREEILNLLVTFNPTMLHLLIAKYREAYQLKIISSNISSNVSQNNELMKQKQLQLGKSTIKAYQTKDKKKKRQISQSSKLPKYSIQVTLMTLLVFLIISLYTILNSLLTKDFFKAFKFHISELSLITQTRSYMSLNYAASYLLHNTYAYKLTPAQLDPILYFFNQTGGQLEDNSKRVEALSSINKNYLSTRYEMAKYQTNIIDVIQSNACLIFQSPYAQQVMNDNKLALFYKCENINGGILKKGLTVALKDFYSKMNVIINNYYLTYGNALGYFKSIKIWDYQNNFKEFDFLYYSVRVILESQTIFLMSQSKDYFDYLMNIQTILFIYCILSVSSIFIFAWRRFLSSMAKKIGETTYLLGLMPIDMLLENPYVMSYLNKEKNRMSKFN